MSVYINLIDVGAYGGLSEVWIIHHYAIAKLLLIDPRFNPMVESKCGGLLEILPFAISDIEGKTNFYQYEKQACNSIFRIKDNPESIMGPGDYSRFKLQKITTVNCVRLDTIISKQSNSFDFLKVDTQGNDLNVVKSMGDYLKDLVGIQVELYLKSVYQDAPMFEDAHEFLSNHGFTCFGAIRKANKIFNDFVYLQLGSTKVQKLELIKKFFGVTDESIPYTKP